MNFQQWLINEELWSMGEGEKYNMDTFQTSKIRFKIYKNPDPIELQNVLDVPSESTCAGGLLMSNGDVYIWPRDFATHNHLAKKKNLINYAVAFYFYPEHGGLQFSRYGPGRDDYESETSLYYEWKESPKILHMIGEPEEVKKAG